MLCALLMKACFWSQPATASFMGSATSSARHKLSSGASCSRSNRHTISGGSMQTVLLLALVGRSTHASPTTSQQADPQTIHEVLRQLVSEPSLTGMLLTSWCAKTYQAFKGAWVQAAATNELPYNEVGLALHEAHLMQHLRQGSAVSQWAASVTQSGASSMRGSSQHSSSNVHNLGCQSAAALSSVPVRLRRVAQTCSQQELSGATPSMPASRGSSSEAGGGVDVEEWKIFADPPDCPVDSALRHAAALPSYIEA